MVAPFEFCAGLRILLPDGRPTTVFSGTDQQKRRHSESPARVGLAQGRESLTETVNPAPPFTWWHGTLSGDTSTLLLACAGQVLDQRVSSCATRTKPRQLPAPRGGLTAAGDNPASVDGTQISHGAKCDADQRTRHCACPRRLGIGTQ